MSNFDATRLCRFGDRDRQRQDTFVVTRVDVTYV
jgi:hypothetical protein